MKCVSDIEYFFAAADTGEYDRLQAAVREREPGRDHRSCHCGNLYQHGCGSDFLQNKGSLTVKVINSVTGIKVSPYIAGF